LTDDFSFSERGKMPPPWKISALGRSPAQLERRQARTDASFLLGKAFLRIGAGAIEDCPRVIERGRQLSSWFSRSKNAVAEHVSDK